MTTPEKPNEDLLPVDYQERDVDWVFKMIRSGESCSLVGIGSVGKSNLMHFLTREDVKQRYLQSYAPSTLMVLLDPHKLVNLHGQALEHAGAHWSGYEIMLNRLRRALIEADDNHLIIKTPGETDDLVERVEDYYLNLFDAQAILAQSGIRHLEEAVYQVMRLGRHWKIVFLFDETEQFIHLPPNFFQSLRGLRDEFKNRVIYVTASRRSLEEMVADAVPDEPGKEMMEGFLELFHGFRRYIGLLERPSAEAMARRLEKRYSVRLDLNNMRNLLNVTGRHAGLLRRSFLPVAAVASAYNSIDQLFEYLLNTPGVTQECQTIFDSLSEGEQRCLQQLVAEQPISPREDCWRSLMDKHIVVQSPTGSMTMTMPILGGFLKQKLARA